VNATVAVYRGDEIESRHDVDFAFADPDTRAAGGDLVFLRSAAKPFQAAAVVASGALDRIGADDETIAIIAASHSGEDKHTSLVARLLERLGLDESALRCGVHPPFDAATAARLGANASPLHHNCSGKHAGMLATALVLGAPIAGYLDLDGPVQRLMRRTVAALCGLATDSVVFAIDGCGAATFAVPLAAGARAFALLARPEAAPAELRAPLTRVAEAMTRRPDLVGGSGRFDTRLIDATSGRLIAKGGAEGVQGVADRASGKAFCLKVRDGAARAVAPATLEALHAAGWIDGDRLASLEDWRRPAITNFSGARVGRIEAALAKGGEESWRTR